MLVLIAKSSMLTMANWYFILCGTFVVGGLVAMFFAGENFAKHAGGISSWVLSGFLLLVGVTLLYIGFSSFLDFTNGSYSTIDSLLDNVEGVGRFLRV